MLELKIPLVQLLRWQLNRAPQSRLASFTSSFASLKLERAPHQLLCAPGPPKFGPLLVYGQLMTSGQKAGTRHLQWKTSAFYTTSTCASLSLSFNLPPTTHLFSSSLVISPLPTSLCPDQFPLSIASWILVCNMSLSITAHPIFSIHNPPQSVTMAITRDYEGYTAQTSYLTTCMKALQLPYRCDGAVKVRDGHGSPFLGPHSKYPTIKWIHSPIELHQDTHTMKCLTRVLGGISREYWETWSPVDDQHLDF